jgi:hypothetical protein
MLKFLDRSDRREEDKSDDESEPGSQTDGFGVSESGNQATAESVDTKIRSQADKLVEPKKQRYDDGFMFKFVKTAFCRFFGVLLWINLAFCMLVGFVRFFSVDEDFVSGLIGVVVGAIVGILINIVWGGFVATIISIEKNTAKSRDAGE